MYLAKVNYQKDNVVQILSDSLKDIIDENLDKKNNIISAIKNINPLKKHKINHNDLSIDTQEERKDN